MLQKWMDGGPGRDRQKEEGLTGRRQQERAIHQLHPVYLTTQREVHTSAGRFFNAFSYTFSKNVAF